MITPPPKKYDISGVKIVDDKTGEPPKMITPPPKYVKGDDRIVDLTGLKFSGEDDDDDRIVSFEIDENFKFGGYKFLIEK